MTAAHVTGDQQDLLDRRGGQSQTPEDKARGEVAANGKLYEPGATAGSYLAVDAGAMPDTPEWNYAKTNAGEQFAEMYAKAVDEPERIYQDFIAEPTRLATEARAHVEQIRNEMSGLSGPELNEKQKELDGAEQAANASEQTRTQRGNRGLDHPRERVPYAEGREGGLGATASTAGTRRQDRRVRARSRPRDDPGAGRRARE